MSNTELYTDVTERDVLIEQLIFQSAGWLVFRDKDEHAAHMNREFLNGRNDSMHIIDGLLDRLLDCMAPQAQDYGE